MEEGLFVTFKTKFLFEINTFFTFLYEYMRYCSTLATITYSKLLTKIISNHIILSVVYASNYCQ